MTPRVLRSAGETWRPEGEIEREKQQAIDAATGPLKEEVERLKEQLRYAEKAKDTLRGKRDNVIGP